ncbi:MFS transporter [Pseudomonas asuensis]|uniref:MFS transporter n=2 Tax=Pseudomonas asuensis TaxID=1825787 RepID=A0ABQ2H2K3_9PSED|nr:MFS transporter [Pseudomonas asuensis]
MLSKELGGSASELNWVVNGYILTYGSAMMAAGSLTDIYGRRRIWLIGLAFFALVTFAIPYARSVFWIDIFRLLQGLGGAAAFAGAMSSLAQTFHGAISTRVFSLIGTTFGVGLAFGPLASGWLVEVAGWAWVFNATAIIGVAGFLLVLRTVRESMTLAGQRLDWLGAVTFTLALAAFTYGVLLAPEYGWRDGWVLGALVLSGIALAAFIRIEQRVANPMLDLSLFSSARFVGVQVLAASPAFFFVVLIVMLPARFMGIEGLTALQAGQLMIGLAAPLLVVPFLAALLSRWLTSGVLCGLGLVLVAIGLMWLGTTVGREGGAHAVLPMIVIGIGIGLPWGLMDGMAVSVVEPERAGMATGIFNAVRVSADGVAIALVGALLATLIQSGLFLSMRDVPRGVLTEVSSRAALGDLRTASTMLPNKTLAIREAYEEGFRFLLFVLAGLSVLTALLVVLLLGRIQVHAGQAPNVKDSLPAPLTPDVH